MFDDYLKRNLYSEKNGDMLTFKDFGMINFNSKSEDVCPNILRDLLFFLFGYTFLPRS